MVSYEMEQRLAADLRGARTRRMRENNREVGQRHRRFGELGDMLAWEDLVRSRPNRRSAWRRSPYCCRAQGWPPWVIPCRLLCSRVFPSNAQHC